MDATIWRQEQAREALATRDISGVYRVLQEAGYSQRQIAAGTRQQQSEVADILAGRRVTSYPVLARIADGIGVPRGHMGLAYVDTPEALHDPKPRPAALATLAPIQTTSPAAPARWGRAEVRALRESMRLSLRGFADTLGVSHRMVSKWEAGVVPRPNNQAALDTALRRSGHEVQARFAWPTWSRRTAELVDDAPRWVVHLVVDAPDLAAAIRTAQLVTAAASALPQLDAGQTQVSREDQQAQRFRVFCDRELPDGRRCPGHHGHVEPCSAGPA